MAQDIELTDIQTIRFAFLRLCRETVETEFKSKRPDSDFLAYLDKACDDIAAAPDLATLCRIHWIAAQSAIAAAP